MTSILNFRTVNSLYSGSSCRININNTTWHLINASKKPQVTKEVDRVTSW